MKRIPRFYKTGLRFECTQCGNCCQLPGGKVFLNGEEIREICRYLNISFDKFIKIYVKEEPGWYFLQNNKNGGCIFLEENRCSIYPVRPNQCNTFPFWPDNLRSHYRWKQISSLCSGIGKGAFHSADWIQQILKMQKDPDNQNRF